MNKEIDWLIRKALEEDIGTGDVTSNFTIPKDMTATAELIAKAEGVISGVDVAEQVFKTVDKNLEVKILLNNGSIVKSKDVIMKIKGNARSILTAERTALNFIRHLSGISTLTNKFVQAAKPTIILDTRKTTPGFRFLEKKAVHFGGGKNHRKGLYDMILIKDNHIKVAGSIAEAVKKAKKSSLTIEVETTNLKEVQEALDAKADIIMLDNMSDKELKKAIKLVNKRAKLEASGNMNLERVKKIANIDLDFISVGAITHSAPNLDLSLEIMYD
ncbi:carboxylating nicotinate-nucleotide diphosphorylase [archaeon]|nr:carboxylating nicotinate-nucleotide diphosphorylase [archaeon]